MKRLLVLGLSCCLVTTSIFVTSWVAYSEEEKVKMHEEKNISSGSEFSELGDLSLLKLVVTNVNVQPTFKIDPFKTISASDYESFYSESGKLVVITMEGNLPYPAKLSIVTSFEMADMIKDPIGLWAGFEYAPKSTTKVNKFYNRTNRIEGSTLLRSPLAYRIDKGSWKDSIGINTAILYDGRGNIKTGTITIEAVYFLPKGVDSFYIYHSHYKNGQKIDRKIILR